jgi:hypothetical protein
LPRGESEYDYAGGLRGEPVEVAKGTFTVFRFPPMRRSLSRARPFRAKANRKDHSANGWAIIPTMWSRGRI